MKQSERYKDYVREDIIGGVVNTTALLVAFVISLAPVVFKTEKLPPMMLWATIVLFVAFCVVAVTSVLDYLSDVEIQKKLEKAEREKEKQQLLNSAH